MSAALKVHPEKKKKLLKEIEIITYTTMKN